MNVLLFTKNSCHTDTIRMIMIILNTENQPYYSKICRIYNIILEVIWHKFKMLQDLILKLRTGKKKKNKKSAER